MRKLGSFEPREAQGASRDGLGRAYRFKRDSREGFFLKILKEKNKRIKKRKNIERIGLLTKPALFSLPSILNLWRRESAGNPSLTIPYTRPEFRRWSNE